MNKDNRNETGGLLRVICSAIVAPLIGWILVVIYAIGLGIIERL